MNELSDKHQAFIDAFFDTRGNMSKAAEKAGFHKDSGKNLVRSLRKEIIKEAEIILAMGAPQAAFTLLDGVDVEGTAPTNPLRIQCAREILDRVGIVKKDQLEISGSENAPLFILPAKHDPRDD